MEQHVAIALDTFTPAQALVLISKGHVNRIPFSQIVRVAKVGFNSQVITTNASYPSLLSLEYIFRELPVNQFARVHKSHIISLGHMHLLGTTVPYSQYYKRILIHQLAHILEQGYLELYEPV